MSKSSIVIQNTWIILFYFFQNYFLFSKLFFIYFKEFRISETYLHFFLIFRLCDLCRNENNVYNMGFNKWSTHKMRVPNKIITFTHCVSSSPVVPNYIVVQLRNKVHVYLCYVSLSSLRNSIVIWNKLKSPMNTGNFPSLFSLEHKVEIFYDVVREHIPAPAIFSCPRKSLLASRYIYT